MILKVSRFTVDMLSQILYEKTEDVGKIYTVFIRQNRIMY